MRAADAGRYAAARLNSMNVILRISIATMLWACGALAQEQPLPRFEDYPAPGKFTGKPVPAIIAGQPARFYRTRIRSGAKEGPNFAGHYTVVTWGCGSGCRWYAVVDARTGRVYFNPKAASVMTVPYQDEDSLQFRIDSRLLVVSGYVWGLRHEQSEAKYYYEWRNNRFKLLRRTQIKKYGP